MGHPVLRCVDIDSDCIPNLDLTMALDKVVDVVMSLLDGDDIFLLLTSSSFSMMSITTLLDSECCVGFNNVADSVKSGCRLLSPDVLEIHL